MKSSSHKTGKKFSVDVLMRKVASALVSDFQDNLNDTDFCSDFQAEVRHGNIVRMRELCPATDDEMDVARFKATYQIASVLKRYRFRKDIYSDQELTDKAVKSYRETQDRLATIDLERLPMLSKAVLDLAARYVARVLGPYDDEECRNLSRFGSGASVGVTARKACEAERWELPMSGSQDQISWFDSEMSQIDQVQEYWARSKGSAPSKDGTTYQETRSLTLSLVPKSFKSLRAIMPNTTVGSYMSDGLGKIIRKRLKRNGYDIASLQMRHRSLAKLASENSLLVTADLSSASDSISVALVKRLFPADWFDILTRSRIGTVCLPDGSYVESQTFCTMGIGYTFPLQTLVFLSLLKAIESIHFGRLNRRTISVYGDDLIYSSRMHDLVRYYFEQFGFVINVEKTFVTGHFRESCGGDYYHGVDVRPFQPRNGPAEVGKHAYEAILYKFVNTLLARWSEYEIGRTLKLLTSEIVHTVQKIKIVPCDYPDDSGVKCPSLTHWDFLVSSHVAKPKHLGHGVYRFSFLRLVPDEREEIRHEPYLWLSLRGYSLRPDYSGMHAGREVLGRVAEQINCSSGVSSTDIHGPLRTKDRVPITSFRSNSGRRLRRTMTCVTISHTGHYKRQSGISCFENRRPFA